DWTSAKPTSVSLPGGSCRSGSVRPTLTSWSGVIGDTPPTAWPMRFDLRAVSREHIMPEQLMDRMRCFETVNRRWKRLVLVLAACSTVVTRLGNPPLSTGVDAGGKGMRARDDGRPFPASDNR